MTSGYGPASEVIHEALRFMETHEDWIHELKLAHLREQLKVGVDQLDRGGRYRNRIKVGAPTVCLMTFSAESNDSVPAYYCASGQI